MNEETLRVLHNEKRILEQLITTGTALHSGQELPDILAAALRGVQALGFDRVRLYLLSADRQLLVGRAHIGMDIPFEGIEFQVAADWSMQRLLAKPHPQLLTRSSNRDTPFEQLLEGVEQWACVPLVFQGKVIGKLAMDNKFSQRPISETELGIVVLLANQAAAAIEHALLLEKTQIATQQTTYQMRNLAAIQEVSRAISSLVDPEAIFQAVCKAVVDLFNVSHSGLVRFDGDYTQGRVVAEYPMWKSVGTVIPVQGVPAEEQLVTSQEPIVLTNIANETSLGVVRDVLVGLKIRSILVVPVVSKGCVLASFSLDVIDLSRIFTKEEIELCKLFAAQVVAALENAQLFTEVRRYAERLEKLRHTSLAITSQLDRDKLLQVIIEQAVAFLEAQGGCIYEYDAERQELNAIADYGLPSDLQNHTLHIGEGAAGRLVQTHQPYIIIDNYEQWSGKALVYNGKVSFGSVIDVLLQWQDRIVGVLCINDVVGRQFTVTDAELLRLFADQAAIAMTNAKLVTQLAEQKDYRERLIASSPIGVVAIDRKGSIVSFNSQAQRVLQYQPQEIIGKPITLLYADLQEPRRIGKRLYESANGKLEDYLTIAYSKQRERIPIRLAATWLYNTRGEQIGSVGYFEDLRVIQETENRLKLLLEASNVVAQAENLTDGLQRLAALLVNFLDVSFGGIQLLDELENKLVVEAAFPIRDGYLEWNPRLGDCTPVTTWPGLAEFLNQPGSHILRMDEQQHQRQLMEISYHYQLKQSIQSMLFIPLRTHQRSVGLLYLGEVRHQGQALFSPAKVELATAIAGQTAVLIDRMRLQESDRLTRQRLHLSFKASNTLTSSADPNQMLHEIVEQARVATSAVWASILLIDEIGYVQSLITAGTDKQFDVSKVIRPNGITMRVMQSGQAEAIEDADQQRERVNPSMFRDKVAAALCLPLLLHGKRIGVMWVHWHEPRRFSVPEVEAMQFYVNQAAIAYDNSRRIAELEHMRQAAEALAGAASVREVLEQIGRGAREVLRADSVVVWSYDAAGDRFILEESVAVEIPTQIWEEFRKIGPRYGGTAYTVMENRWVGVDNIEDIDQYPFIGRSTRDLLSRVGAKGFQGIALETDGENLGVLYVNFNRPHSFSREESETAQTFAYHAALALRKAKLLEQVSKARNTAEVVAQVTTLGDLDDTLQSIAKGTKDALSCDAVTLYAYGQPKDKLKYPPTLVGVYNEAAVRRKPEVSRNSIIFQMMNRSEVYIVEDVTKDVLFQKTRFAREEGIAACVAIPLRVGDEQAGVMFVNYRTRRRFTSVELANIELFAHQAAVAIRNAQLYEEVQKRANVLEALYGAGHLIASSLDLNEILYRIVEQASLLTGAGNRRSGSNIALAEGTVLQYKASYPRGRLAQTHAVLGKEIDLNTGKDGRIGIIGRVIKTGEPQRINDVKQHPDYLMSHLETRSELAVPIKINNKVIGAINTEHSELNAFEQEHLYALEMLAAQAAIAIHNAQLYEQQQRRVAALEALHKAGQSIISSLELEKILSNIAEQMWKFTHNYDKQGLFSHISLIEGSRLNFKTAYPSNHLSGLQKVVGSIDLENGERIGIVGRAVQEKRLQLVSDVSKDPDYIPYAPNTLSEWAVPIKVDEQVIGVISVESPRYYTFDEEDVRTLESLATQAAIAIRNAQRFEELKRIKGYIGTKTAVEWIQMVSTAWGHSVRREVGTARGHIALLERLLNHGEKRQEALEEIKQLAAVISDIGEIPIIAPLSYEDAVASVAVNKLVHTYLTRVWKLAPYKEVALQFTLQTDLDANATVWVSPEWLRRVFEIVVDNAVYAMLRGNPPHQPKQLQVSTALVDSAIIIGFKDTGPGIPPPVMAKLFENPIDKPEGSRGAGIGMMLAKTIMQTYRGDIMVQDTGSNGTYIAITLPVE